MSDWITINRLDPETLPLRGQVVDFYDKMFDKVIEGVVVNFNPQYTDLDITKWRPACDCRYRGCKEYICKGQCGCEKCHENYMDFMSCE